MQIAEYKFWRAFIDPTGTVVASNLQVPKQRVFSNTIYNKLTTKLRSSRPIDECRQATKQKKHKDSIY